MTFDKPEHKAMVLEMINRATVPGVLIEKWAELKAVASAAAVEPPKPNDKDA
jgi:hypothetical protein